MQQPIFTVSELNQAAQKILEGHFSQIWVQGELSNLSRPASGHFYFTLKDQKSAIRCALFRSQAQKLTFELRDGLLVQVKAKVSIYPDRGDYQLIIESVEQGGEGLLRQAFDQLVQKLKTKGLFEAHHKKPIPSFPQHLGIITSPTGAAIRDILTILKRRFPRLEVTIYPTTVQGTTAATEIVSAIQKANQYAQSDLLILARGGGAASKISGVSMKNPWQMRFLQAKSQSLPESDMKLILPLLILSQITAPLPLQLRPNWQHPISNPRSCNDLSP